MVTAKPIKVIVTFLEDIETSTPFLNNENTDNEAENIQEHEIVVAKTDIAKVPKGTTGVVVYIYEGNDAYEVEFIVNSTSFIETALKNQIEKK